MVVISAHLQKVLDEYFGYKSGPKSPAQSKLEGAIKSSDSLSNLLNSAATPTDPADLKTALLQRIQPNGKYGSGAAFGSNTLFINIADILNTSDTMLVAYIAHEIQHGIDAGRLTSSWNSFQNSVLLIAQPGTQDKDVKYEDAARIFAAGQSVLEARAEMRAWNAIVDKLTQQNNGRVPTLEEIYHDYPRARSSDGYIEQKFQGVVNGQVSYSYSLRGGITLDKTTKKALLSTDDSTSNANEQAFAQQYYYSSSKYLSWVVAALMENAGSSNSISINLSHLGFSVSASPLNDAESLKVLTSDLNSYFERNSSQSGQYTFTDAGTNQTIICTHQNTGTGTVTSCANPNNGLSVTLGNDYTKGTMTTTTVNNNPGGLQRTFNEEVDKIDGGIRLSEISGTETVSGEIVSASITGSGVEVTTNNAAITLVDGAQADVIGTGNSFTVGSGASLTCEAPSDTSNGQPNQFILGSNAILIDNAGSATIADIISSVVGATGINVTVASGNASLDVCGATLTVAAGASATITAAVGAGVSINGAGGKLVNLGTGSRATVTGTETGETIAGSDPDLVLFLAADGQGYIGLNGNPIVSIPSGASIALNGDTFSMQLSTGSFTGNISLTGSSVTTNWTSADSNFSVRYSTDFIVGGEAIQWTQNGQTFSGGDLGSFISNAYGQAVLAFSVSEAQKSTANESSLMATPASGVAAALANASSNRYLSARLALGNVSDHWAPAFLSGEIAAGMLVSSSQSAAIRQALANIAQQQWQARQSLPSIFDVRVLGLGSDANFSYPLVLDLSGAGIKLVAPSQSNASFDLDANGTREASGWVGADNGILVFDKNGNGRVDGAAEWFGGSFATGSATPPANQTGFAALSTLTVAGATQFSRETAAIDPATGKSYFDLVQVWVDANQDGVTDKGELRSLAELGIVSIDLGAVADGRKIAGGEIALTAGYTKVDGSHGTIADVGLAAATPGSVAPSPWVPSTAALLFAEYASKGYAALSKGQAQGIANALATNSVNVAGTVAALQARMATDRVLVSQGYAAPLIKVRDRTLITFYSGEEASTQQGSRAGIDVLALLQDSAGLAVASAGSAQAVAAGADAIIQAHSAAQVSNATGEATARARADSLASSSAMSWGQAISVYLNAAMTSTQLSQRAETARIELNALVPVANSYFNNLPGGYTFFSPGDASFAAEAFDGFASALQILSNSKISLDGVLSAIAQSAGYSTVYVGHAGETLVAGNGFNLLLAGSGAETFSLGSNVDHVALSTASGAVTVNGFQTGASGDQIQLLDVGDKVSVRSIAGGIQLLVGDGQRYVNLNGVNTDNLSLFSNLTGVSEISFADFNQAGTRSIEGQRLYDGQVHIRKIIGSNYGDTLIGDSEAVTLVGGRGDDTFIVAGRGYQIDGGIGEDRVSYARSEQGVTVNLQAGNDCLGSSLFQVEHIVGSNYRDVLTGDTHSNVFDGGQGYDTIVGGGGNDVYLFGRGDGVDTVVNGIDANVGASSILRFKAGIEANQLWFSRDGNDLVVQILGVNDRVIVSGWFVQANRKLGAIELANGRRLDVAAVEGLVASLATYQAAHSDFDPRTVVNLPSTISNVGAFSDHVEVPQVAQASNVSLEVQRAYQSARATQGAATATSVAASMNASAGTVSSANANARYWRSQVAPIGIPSGYHLYRYQSNLTSDTLFAVTQKDFNSANPLMGRGSDVISWRELGALESDRLYFKKTVASSRPPSSSSTSIFEWAIGTIDGILNDNDVVTANLNVLAGSSTQIGSAASSRQLALAAAINANTTGSSAASQQARQSALNFERNFGVAVSAYQALGGNLAQISGAISRNASRISTLVPADSSWSEQEWIPENNIWGHKPGYWLTITHSTTYSFYSSTDANKYNSVISAQSAAQNSYNAAVSNLSNLLNVFATMGDWSNAQIVSAGGSATASAGGDLMVSLGGGNHVFYGGAARDTFAFVSGVGAGADSINAFQAGATGDRLLIVPTTARLAYLSEGAGGSVKLSYEVDGSTLGTVQLTNVNYQDFSLYDNLRGIETADFRNMQHGVNITLNSVTLRDADAFTHVRNISGTAYADTISSDTQDNELAGGAGDDILMGGIGNDTYIWRKGDGNDIIREQDQGVTSGNIDVLKLADVSAAQVSYSRRGNDLLVTILPTNEVITIQSQYATMDQRVEVVEFGDGTRRVLPVTNTLPTGTVDIKVGSTVVNASMPVAQSDVMTAVVNITDPDGIGQLRYQWYADETAIAGATLVTFAPGQSEVGKKISVRMEYTDGFGTAEKANSLQIVPVTNKNDAPVGGVSITGTPMEGQTLTASNTLTDADGMGAVHYQWFANDVAIDGATSDTLVLTPVAGNKKISVKASYVDGFGASEAVFSTETAPVAHLNRPCSGAVSMLLNGQIIDVANPLKQGDVLRVQAALSDPDGLGQITYRWYADGQAIEGAVGEQIALTQAQVGRRITVEAEYTDGYGTNEKIVSSASGPIANVNDAPVGTITLTGKAVLGAQLIVQQRFSDADGIGALRYRWYADDQLISGQTDSRLTLSADIIGKSIRALVEYEDGFGTTEMVSSVPTGPVLAGIVGTSRDDTLYGTPGADTMIGLAGNDTYYLDDPRDIIIEQPNEGTDTVYVPFDYSLPANVEYIHATVNHVNLAGNGQNNTFLFDRSGGNRVDGAGGLDAVNYAYSVNSTTAKIYEYGESFELDTHSDVLFGVRNLLGSRYNDVLTGNQGDNLIYGLAGDDVLWGRGGNDTLVGGIGSDTFIFGRGDGTDRVTDGGTNPQERNVLSFGANVSPEQLWFQRVGTTLEISIIGTSDKLVIQNWSSGQGIYAIQEIKTSNGYVLTPAKVESLVNAMASLSPPPLGTLTLNSSYASYLAPIFSTTWHLNRPATGSINVAGTGRVGSSLIANPAVQDADGIASPYCYQWLANSELISGATSQSFVVTADQAGKAISVRVSFVDQFGAGEVINSQPITIPLAANGVMTKVDLANGGASVFDAAVANDLVADSALASMLSSSSSVGSANTLYAVQPASVAENGLASGAQAQAVDLSGMSVYSVASTSDAWIPCSQAHAQVELEQLVQAMASFAPAAAGAFSTPMMHPQTSEAIALVAVH